MTVSKKGIVPYPVSSPPFLDSIRPRVAFFKLKGLRLLNLRKISPKYFRQVPLIYIRLKLNIMGY